MHGRCQVVHPSEDNDLLEQCGRDGNVGHRVHVDVEEDGGAEVARQGVRQKVVKHVVILCIPCGSVDVGRSMRSHVVERDLSIVGQ